MNRAKICRWFTRPLLAVVLCCLVESTPARSQPTEPNDLFRTTESDPFAPRPCVLLSNGNVVFGTAHQVGNEVVIHGDGGEISLRYQDVACWGESLQQLYRFRVDQRRGDSNTAKIADAKWCIRYGLMQEAEDELLSLHPRAKTSRDYTVLLRQIRDHRRSKQHHGLASEPPVQADVRQVDFETIADVANAKPSVDLPADLVQAFTRHIQPILLNRCGQCHNGRFETDFPLSIPAGGRRPSASMTQENLHLSLAYVDVLDDSQSLTWFATHAHGHAKSPPLSSRDATAEQNLRSWTIAARNRMSTDDDSNADVGLADGSIDGPASPSAATAMPATSVRPDETSRLPQVADPFDPERFNRQFHR